MEKLRGDNTERYAWLIGGGLGSLSAAVFMIRDINMKGENIHIYERYERSDNSLKEKEEIEKETITPEKHISDYEQYPSFIDLLENIPVGRETPSLNSDYSIIIESIRNWLKEQGVRFEKITYLADLQFIQYADTDEEVVKAIHYIKDGKEYTQDTGFEDMVIITGGYIADIMDTDMPFHISTTPLEIRPSGYHNLAFASHLTEKQKDKQFNPEETVKSAKKAVLELLEIKE